MNIDEAIEILEKEEEDTFIGSENDWKCAVKLGIEALKRIKELHSGGYMVREGLLPGETEE